MTARYATQMSLRGVGESGQTLLSEAEILVVGGGGLGCAVLPWLVGAGIGKIHIFDGDSVEEKNLHRQILYRTDDIGKNKAVCLRNTLLNLNNTIEIRAYPHFINSVTAKDILTENMIVVDAADNFATTYMLSDLCKSYGNTLISGSAIGWGGYVGAFCGESPSYRAVFPSMARSSADCSSGGIIGPVVATIGSLQAQICLSMVLKKAPLPRSILYRWDAETMRMRSFSFENASEPEQRWPFISWSELTEDDIIIDVRALGETPFIQRHNVMSLPLNEFSTSINDRVFSNEKRLVLCCQSGVRAAQAAEMLHERGNYTIALLALKQQSL